ncbi:hypothetical protein SB384_10430 [Burkholderia cenocepacia]|uniref:hypothetical protein n=1 Tax=Burkholderia cenocepacia TaxID=95486 RepID=UPI002B23F025|nr:hypothetical protein [Burkholderia cenocepacia]MEB2600063.1 hypothetical protein [Burkholderia cenocepacia]
MSASRASRLESGVAAACCCASAAATAACWPTCAAAALPASTVPFATGCWLLIGASAGSAYSQIPIYPQAFGGYATRLEGGRGGMASLAKGGIGSYTTDNNPVFSSQLWTQFNETISTNWAANMKVQTTVGPNSNAFTAGIFSEIMSYAPNNAEQIAIVGHARAQANRNASGTGSGGDLWGGWFDANNQGYLAHCIGIEVNVTNQYGNWMESSTPLQTDPAHYTFGIQVYPDWSTYHNSRAISIRPNSTVGFSTGILCTGWVDQGMFIDSGIYWRDPPGNTQLASPIGILFGSNIATKIAVQKGTSTPWKLNGEGTFLLWRGSPTQWFWGMDSSDNSVSVANSLISGRHGHSCRSTPASLFCLYSSSCSSFSTGT